ncbi:DUF4352 domain-containing protein [Mycobacterium sp. 1274761.0]|uniref:DUF4352 domain-containing protein n=1 Tax=Mycobacterium sp. 1274761.0 TaxID=1834077 RepID=UPI000AA8C227|nr:DUF4352 domain-containing protein [Mycobacterium sp. 1274761.0]
MTTTPPPTPSGWYPDPEQAGQLRYWDGTAWSEHRSPAQEPPTAAPQDPDAEAEPAAEPEPPATEQPTTEVPLREWSFEPPPLEPEAPPRPPWEPDAPAEPTSAPTPEPTGASSLPPVSELSTEKVPLRDWTAESTPESAPYADATSTTPAEPPAVEPPAGTEPRQAVDNRKLVLGYGGAVAALLLALVLAAVYAFVIHKPDTVDIASPNNETATTTPENTTPSEGPTEAQAPPPGASATDGPLTFTVTGVDRGPTITDSENEFLTKDAQGEFIVVHLTVQNTSPDAGQFLGTFQKLNAGGQVFTVDDQATFYVGGGFVDVPPGSQFDVGLAYDVPPGTTPESIELHADPTSPGVVLPLS